MKRASIVTGLLVASLGYGSTSFAKSARAAAARLNTHAASLLQEAIDAGKKEVVIIVATTVGQGDSVAQTLEALGAMVVNNDNALGYVSARIATDKVKIAGALEGVLAVDLDEKFPLLPPAA